MTTTEPVHKLDIFRVLNAANAKDIDFYSKLDEAEQKAFQPFLVMRWMSGTSDARQVYFINELLNPYVWSLTNHKELLWNILTICNSGKSQRYSWNKLPAKVTSSKPMSAKMVSQYFGYSLKEANTALLLLSKDDILSIAADLGLQPDEITKVKKEHKDHKSELNVDLPTKPTQIHDDLLEF